ncbi:hypothetical protein JYT51_00320 [Candidatus Amoebophilus asiaticus]|nr:hypothetical protein [Candidatus Amoebophilus asiaticus]
MKVNSIVNRGLIIVYGPMICFVGLTTCLAFWTAKNIFMSEIAEFIAAITMFGSILLSWIWWSIKIVKWKCWAFSKLKHKESVELYFRAIEVGLIWQNGSIFNKTEIWTENDKEKWSSLDSRIQQIFSNTD